MRLPKEKLDLLHSVLTDYRCLEDNENVDNITSRSKGEFTEVRGLIEEIYEHFDYMFDVYDRNINSSR